jgi:hypothetical protein
MTPRSSVRARAREIYREMAEKASPRESASEAARTGVTPLPDPPPHSSPDGERPLAYGGREKKEGGRGQAEQAVAAQPSLTARARALYEDSAVPVREIARLCGVTERTIYKYVAKGGWTKRYARTPQAIDGAADVAPVKGAGGRFIRREDKGKAFAKGLKATDPAARARAELACAAASARHAKARAKADLAQVWEARRRAIDTVSAAMAAYNRWRRTRLRRWARPFYLGGPNDAAMEADRRMEALYIDHIQAAIAAVKNPPE